MVLGMEPGKVGWVEPSNPQERPDAWRRRRRIALPIVVLGCAAMALTGCERQAVKAGGDCVAYGADKKPVLPHSYGHDQITLLYLNKWQETNSEQSTQGTIKNDGDKQWVDVKDFPKTKDLGRIGWFGSSHMVAVEVNDPATIGEIGFSAGCITRGYDDNNLPTTFISLPTK